MKSKYDIFKITKADILARDREGRPIRFENHHMILECERFHKQQCEKANCDNHYKIVRVNITDDDESDEPLFAILNTANGRLM